MLTSPTRREDQEHYAVMADIVEIAYRHYKKTQNPRVLEALSGFIEELDKLKNRIDTHDYTEEDRRYWELNRLSTRRGLDI